MKVGNGLDLQGQGIKNVADPALGTDAANRQYVDNVARGMYWKNPVRAASTANINVASPGASIDGVALANGDRVLLKNQTAAAENGPYQFNGSATALTRTLDADTSGELNPGTAVTVTEGTTNADKVFMIISDAVITIGSTAQTWAQFGGGQTYTGSNGVQLVGADFRGVAAAGGGLTVGASGFAIDTSVVTRKIAGNMGNGTLTVITVTHNLGSTDVQAMVRDASTGEFVLSDWKPADANSVTFTFGSAPASNSVRFMIQG